MKNRKIVVLLVALVVVCGLAFASLSGLYPPKSGVEGTIGGAKRYTAGQISEKDVVLTDAQIQAFLQSDLFHKMTTDPDFRKLVTSEEFSKLAGTEEFSKLVTTDEFNKVSETDEFRSW